MKSQARGKSLVWVRRVVQGACLTFFLVLILATRAWESGSPSSAVKLFFDLDPLVLVATWLATHSLEGLSLLALITLAVTLLLGRVYCGWICPFGVLHNMLSWLRPGRQKGRPRLELFSRWQRAKYLLLVALLVMAGFGAHWIGVFDPIAMLYRSTTITVLPAVQYLVEDGANVIYERDPHLGPARVTTVSEPVYDFFREQVFIGQRQLFSGSSLILLLFVAALLLNLWRPRFWCRYVCPLGALLGLFARRGILRLVNDPEACTDCGLCAKACPAAAQPDIAGEWLPDECFGCWNCVASCNQGGIDFAFTWPWRRPVAGSIDLSRRAVMQSLGAGIGGLFMMRITPLAQGATYNPALIRPPGARHEDEFLRRCIQCGGCMKVCPSNALHPTLLEAGLEGIWSPLLIARLGYCEYECNLCGQVCPTGAIEPLPLDEKKKVVIGLAMIDTRRCLPYAYDRDCIVCEEHCPIPTKAIYFVEQEITRRDGSLHVIKLPRVDAALCNGCGICETKCPFVDWAGILITSANETRHPDNQPILLPPVRAPSDSGI